MAEITEASNHTPEVDGFNTIVVANAPAAPVREYGIFKNGTWVIHMSDGSREILD